MTERSTITQITQLGIEVTPGVLVPATVKMSSFDFAIGPNITFSTVRPSGKKFKTRVIPGKEYTDLAVTAAGAVFTDLVYALSSVVAKPVITVPTGGILSHQWAFDSNADTADVIQTYSVEHGSAARASNIAGCFFNAFNLKWDRNGITPSGSMVGGLLNDNQALTSGGITTLAPSPFLPGKTDVWIDTAAAGLGTTKQHRIFAGEFDIADRFGTIWPLDSTLPSFAASVEKEMPLTLKLTAEADAEGMALLAVMRQGDTRFVRVQFQGELIEGVIYRSMILDFAGEVSAVSKLQDTEGVYGIEWTLTGVDDPTWTKAFEIKVVNELSAL